MHPRPTRQIESHPLRDDLLWARFRNAGSAAEFQQHWLAIQCRALPGVLAGLLLDCHDPDHPGVHAAHWPAEAEPGAALIETAERALKQNHLLVARPAAAGAASILVGMPIMAGEAVVAVVALEVAARADADLQQLVRELSWGTAWIALRQAAGGDGQNRQQLPAAFGDLLASALEHDHFTGCATSFLNELADQLGASRATLGLESHGHIRVTAVSHSARFSQRSDLSRLTEAAMTEAAGRPEMTVWTGDDPATDLRLHQDLAHLTGARFVCSIPFVHGDAGGGVVTVERDQPREFTPAEVDLLNAAVTVAGPLLHLQHLDEQWLTTKAWRAADQTWRDLRAAGHLTPKVAVAGAVLLLAFLMLYPATYRVSADSVLEPEISIAAVAPYEGFIATPKVRAGERVKQGDLLVQLDDREYKLERVRWDSELQRLTTQYRQLFSEDKVAEVEMVTAQMAQARSQLALADDRLTRSAIRAPVDGIVVIGDLSKEIGTPVTRGQVLFEVAPLDRYRLILHVREDDIGSVRVGQKGGLTLTATPGQRLGFAVQRITPVSEAIKNHNTFRVEAQLEGVPDWLRPGMEGIGKVEVGTRNPLWIATHDLLDWWRLTVWRWLP